MSTSTMSQLALMLFGPIAMLGMTAAVYGRMGIRTINGRFVGSPASWVGYWGGQILVVVAVALFVIGVVGLLG